ncbi:MAG TPA: hypothetical protein VMH80_27600 [Bryobacteraceae bacterium]|nr:hypothetical protein [Bryobacteraceae bacterium]
MLGPAAQEIAYLPVLPPSVLILDSDPAVRKLLRRLLERSGYFVTELAGVEDLELRPRRFNLLIADLGPLRQADLEIVKQLAAMHPGMKVIQLSSQPLAGAAPDGSLVLSKPFHGDALLEVVRQALGVSEANSPWAEAGPHVKAEGA